MAKYFMGSVGKAEAFRVNNGKLEKAFVSKTLTDSGLNISTTKDDIRGGQGAPIQFSFYHDPSVEITLTDIVWEKEYVTAQLGAEFDINDNRAYKSGKYNFAEGSNLTLNDIQPLPLNCGDADAYAVWFSKPGKDDWYMLDHVSGNEFKLPEGFENGEYCYRYLGNDNNAVAATINSQIIPSELFLIITAPLFAGDACAATRGKAAGSVQFEIPRFLLNGNQEFTMNMSSNQTMSLSGIALASTSYDCEEDAGTLLRIIEVKNGSDWINDLDDLVADPDYLKAGDTAIFYGITKDKKVRNLSNEYIVCDKLDDAGKWKSEGAPYKAEFSFKDHPEIKGEAYILAE